MERVSILASNTDVASQLTRLNVASQLALMVIRKLNPKLFCCCMATGIQLTVVFLLLLLTDSAAAAAAAAAAILLFHDPIYCFNG